MHRLILALALALAACVAAPQIAGFRPASAPIWSSAAFLPAKIEGSWTQVATFSAGKGLGCAPGGLRFARTGAGLAVQGKLCLNGKMQRIAGVMRPSGPGRMTLPGMAEWWVIWVDADYRTLAIGTPDGSFGFILDRGKIGADRLRAAAEIFTFNGYAKGRLFAF